MFYGHIHRGIDIEVPELAITISLSVLCPSLSGPLEPPPPPQMTPRR